MKVSAQIGLLSAAETQAIAAATVVMHEYMAAFNSRDPARWADTLFPHVRISSGGWWCIQRDEFVAQMDFAAFAQRNSWQRSAWDYLEVVQEALARSILRCDSPATIPNNNLRRV